MQHKKAKQRLVNRMLKRQGIIGESRLAQAAITCITAYPDQRGQVMIDLSELLEEHDYCKERVIAFVEDWLML